MPKWDLLLVISFRPNFFPAIQMYLRGSMEDGVFSRWKKKERIIWVLIIFLQLTHSLQPFAASFCLCHITAYFHTVLPAGQKEKSPVGLIMTPRRSQLLKNGSNLDFGEKTRWGTNEAPRLACSPAVLSSNLNSSIVCRRWQRWTVWVPVGYRRGRGAAVLGGPKMCSLIRGSSAPVMYACWPRGKSLQGSRQAFVLLQSFWIFT